jgi:hypothetical protein
MPIQRAQLGGAFGSGLLPPAGPRGLDLTGAIDAALSGATSLVHMAVLRKQAAQARQDRLTFQQQQADAQRQQRDQQAAQFGATHGLAVERLGLDREKFGAETATREADARRKEAELAAQGIVPQAAAEQDATDPTGTPTRSIDPAHFEDLGGGYYRDRLHNPKAEDRAAADARERATIAAAAAREQASIAGADRRAAAQNATTLQAAQTRANATGTEKDGKAAGDLANQYAHTWPVESADKFASNAANALAGVQLARQGNREGHLMAITGFLRQTHPDAVVRTNDKGMLEEVQGVPANVAMTVKRWIGKGGLLTDPALAEIEHATRTMVATQRAALGPVQAFYGRQARVRGLDSASVVRDPFQGLDAATGATSDAAAARDALAQDPAFRAFVEQARPPAPRPPAPRLTVPPRRTP